jgi:hypothetical protein
MRLNVFSSTSRQKRERRLISIWIVTERIDEMLAKVCSSMSVNFVVDGRVFWRFAGVTCTALPHIATRRHPRFEKAVHVTSNTSALRLFDICPKKGVCVRSEERDMCSIRGKTACCSTFPMETRPRVGCVYGHIAGPAAILMPIWRNFHLPTSRETSCFVSGAMQE